MSVNSMTTTSTLGVPSLFDQKAFQQKEDLKAKVSSEEDVKTQQANEFQASYTSVFNGASTINNEIFAVTLVRDRGNNHARIVIERVEGQKRFISVAHFTGPKSGCDLDKNKFGKVKLNEITGEKLKKFSVKNYSSRSIVWSISAAKVKAMLASIKSEISNPTDNPNAFSIFGKKSSLSYSPGFVRISEDIITSESERKSVQELEKLQWDNPTQFDYLVSLLKEDQNISRAFQRVFNILEIPKSESEIPKKVVKFSLGLLSLLHPFNIITILGTIKHRDALCLLKKHGIQLKPNNCFTWARDKINMLDSDTKLLPEKSSDSFIAVTKFYTPYTIK